MFAAGGFRNRPACVCNVQPCVRTSEFDSSTRQPYGGPAFGSTDPGFGGLRSKAEIGGLFACQLPRWQNPNR
jgi:hypothetical protein